MQNWSEKSPEMWLIFFLKRAPFQSETEPKNQTHFSRLNCKNTRLRPEFLFKHEIYFRKMKTQKLIETLQIPVPFSCGFWAAPWAPVPHDRLTVGKNNCPTLALPKGSPLPRNEQTLHFFYTAPRTQLDAPSSPFSAVPDWLRKNLNCPPNKIVSKKQQRLNDAKHPMRWPQMSTTLASNTTGSR